MKIDKFNKEWFDKWKKIEKIEPHYDTWYGEDEETKETVIDFIDIVFTDGNRIRIEAEGQVASNEYNEHFCMAWLNIKTAKMEEVVFYDKINEEEERESNKKLEKELKDNHGGNVE